MNNLIKLDNDRLRLFKKYGYDIPRARQFILTKAKVSGEKILDVGTGKGHMAVALAKNGLRVVSIDLDRKAQDVARLKLKNLKFAKLVSLRNMDAERLKYKGNYFDDVISVNFLHHARNPIKCLKEMARVAKNKLIIADLNKRGEKIMGKVHGLDGHRHHASKLSLLRARALLEEIGMDVKTYHDTCQTVLVAKKGEKR